MSCHWIIKKHFNNCIKKTVLVLRNNPIRAIPVEKICLIYEKNRISFAKKYVNWHKVQYDGRHIGIYMNNTEYADSELF